MKKTILALASAAIIATAANAADDIMKVTMNNGTVHSLNVSDIKDITFDAVEDENPLVGDYSGVLNANIGGQFNYSTDGDVTYKVEEGTDGTLNVMVPTYQLSNTMMGNLTIGGYQVTGLSLDSATGEYVKVYGGDGQTIHFTAEGATPMDGDYAFTENCKLALKKTDTGVTIKNEFKMGRMPFLITTSFEGKK